ncbi:MAG: hypothetical protein ACXWE8_10500, partial [Solirubrobacterales bacterium]
MWLTRIRWERAVRPLVLIGAGLAALALLPALFEGGAPPPPPADVGFAQAAAAPAVGQLAAAPPVAS